MTNSRLFPTPPVSCGLTRRDCLALLGGATVALAASGCAGAASSETATAFSELEQRVGGRLGVQLLHATAGTSLGYRQHERFALCSTFKLPLAAVILHEAQAGHIDLDTEIAYSEADMINYAPVTSEHLSVGRLSIRELARAAQTTSDNVAANLLLRALGGPAALTKRLRDLGDSVTRIDRYEPEMNLVPDGEIRDTSSPAAMAASVASFLSGDYLNADNQALLQRWMIETRTGSRRLRAGLSATGVIGNKTGTGIAREMSNQYNDIAVVWDESAGLQIVAAYYQADGHSPGIVAEHEAVLAEVGRIAWDWMQRSA